jgi:1-aminocyclopropane-1-carboxylate deaminase/D-cysteine desulfhydrase-like pyridoxal-dependent ACC family enzyme
VTGTDGTCCHGCCGTKVDASQRQQAASYFARACPEQITPGLQQVQFLPLSPIVTVGQLQGTGKTHAGLALGLAACQRGFSVAFFTAAGLVHQLMEARDERRLLKLQAQLADCFELTRSNASPLPASARHGQFRRPRATRTIVTTRSSLWRTPAPPQARKSTKRR